MGRRAAVIAIALAAAVVGCATDPAIRRADRRRALHGGAVVAGGAAYIVVEAAFKDDLAADPCRWCTPSGLDAGARDALRWDDTTLADQLSDATGFYLAPLTSFGFLALATRPDRDVRRFLDDALPVAESAVLAALVHHGVKFAAGRQRPLAHYGEPGRVPELDDNMSFYSGHTQVAFAVVTASGTVARLRDHPIEPWIWGVGLPLAAATGYLRIAADKHYLIDVSTGALLGSAAGLLLPRVLLGERAGRERPVVVPAPGGVAIVGTF
jgi:membrane-associated phospholipid phosphatase